MEARAQIKEAQEKAKKVILEVFDEWEKRFDRKYKPVESYLMEDAEYAFLTMGSSAGNARTAVDELRAKGEKVGLIKIRVYRPFFGEEVVKLCKNLKGLITIERSHSFGGPGGILARDVKSSLYGTGVNPLMAEYTIGLGGRDTLVKEYHQMFNRSKEAFEAGKSLPIYWRGLRE
ncbi:MAG: transketolase C-terminal domain-containing protein [Candidatus Hodarchaeales archaeon]